MDNASIPLKVIQVSSPAVNLISLAITVSLAASIVLVNYGMCLVGSVLKRLEVIMMKC